jgi:pyruvate dehydrogenase kinase 2/3/4
VAEGGEDVTVKVSDEGGGIPRSGLARIWTYLYSTAKDTVNVEQLQVWGVGQDRSVC